MNVTPHINLGYEVSTESDLNNLRYALGFDIAPTRELTFAADLIGRWEPSGDDIGDSKLDFALGGKWNFLGTSILNASVLLPVNKNSGLRADVIWTIGVEHTF